MRAIARYLKAPGGNEVLGHICTVFFCGCHGNWRLNHNRHHAYPNQVVKDPDIEIPFGFTPEFYQQISGFIGSVKKYQKYTYYPLGLMASLAMRLSATIISKKISVQIFIGKLACFSFRLCGDLCFHFCCWVRSEDPCLSWFRPW